MIVPVENATTIFPTSTTQEEAQVNHFDHTVTQLSDDVEMNKEWEKTSEDLARTFWGFFNLFLNLCPQYSPSIALLRDQNLCIPMEFFPVESIISIIQE